MKCHSSIRIRRRRSRISNLSKTEAGREGKRNCTLSIPLRPTPGFTTLLMLCSRRICIIDSQRSPNCTNQREFIVLYKSWIQGVLLFFLTALLPAPIPCPFPIPGVNFTRRGGGATVNVHGASRPDEWLAVHAAAGRQTCLSMVWSLRLNLPYGVKNILQQSVRRV